MGKILETAFASFMLVGFLIAALPQTADGMSHGMGPATCDGYGDLDGGGCGTSGKHCNHTGHMSMMGGSGVDCCGNPGWLASNPPAPPPYASGAGIASSGNDAKTLSRLVSTRPRAIGRYKPRLTY